MCAAGASFRTVPPRRGADYNEGGGGAQESESGRGSCCPIPGSRASGRGGVGMRGIRIGFAAAVVSIGCASSPAPPSAFDWNAKWQQVHIDHVDPARSEVFEGARTRWLANLA